MAEVVVAGAGVAGPAAALVVDRQGHRVTLLERDATPLPPTPDEAFAWDRRGAPQVRHSHAFLARLRNLLRDDHPDVLAALFEAGATELRFLEHLPPEFPDHSVHPGDEDLVALAGRGGRGHRDRPLLTVLPAAGPDRAAPNVPPGRW